MYLIKHSIQIQFIQDPFCKTIVPKPFVIHGIILVFCEENLELSGMVPLSHDGTAKVVYTSIDRTSRKIVKFLPFRVRYGLASQAGDTYSRSV